MYAFDLDPHQIFTDRTPQWAALGLPLDDIDAVRVEVTDMWGDGPGGWSHEWSELAQSYATSGAHGRAAYAYGCAHFPCVNTTARAHALDRQLEQYLLAAEHFPVQFERRTIDVPYQGASLKLPIHLYSGDGQYASRPVLIAHGGVDTFKMDFDPFVLALTQGASVTTLAIDMPGTGETSVPLGPEADELIAGIVHYARTLGDGRVAHFATSFGGNFSAMSGLTGLVDAAIDVGGPLVESLSAGHLAKLPYGMRDIVGNALHLDAPPALADLQRAVAALSRRDLLDAASDTPMLIVNGADDYFIAPSDTLVFQNRPHTEVHLLDHTGHCAMSRAPEVVQLITTWLQTQFAQPNKEQ